MRTLATVLAALLILAATSTAGAHGGGLDGAGCHGETATGGYHCHRGGDDDKGRSNQRKTWEAIGYVAGGILVLKLVFGVLRRLEPPERGLRFTLVQKDRVGAFVEWRF